MQTIKATLQVLDVHPQCDDALALLDEAAVEASLLYPEFHDANAPGPTNQPNSLHGIYLVAYLGGKPVGMAAHRPLDESTTEIRRMYVKTASRRAGIARTLMQWLEEHAKSVGFKDLVLETGHRQIPAIELYKECGFTRIKPFGPYQDDPSSVCFKKAIHALSPSEAPIKPQASSCISASA